MSKHTNSYTYSQKSSSYSQSGGYYGKYSEHSWNDHCYYEGGCWYYCWHSNSNSYSNYGNHTNRYYAGENYTQLTTNTTNESPSISGSISPSSGTLTGTVVTININNIIYSDSESDAWSKWRIYASGPSYTNIQQLAELSESTKTYSWNIGSLNAGNYYLYITVYDGYTWSALPDGSSWKAHYIEEGNSRVSSMENSPINYYESEVITVLKYSVPTWIDEEYCQDEEYLQVKNETIKARNAFGLSSFSFTNDIVVNNFQKITAVDFNEVRTAANEIYVKQKGGDYPFTSGAITIASESVVKKVDINDIKELLEALTE